MNEGQPTEEFLSLLLTELAEEAADYIKGTRNKKMSRIIDDVLAYLMEEFRNSDISLKFVLQKFQLNSSYLSRIFKQETGQVSPIICLSFVLMRLLRL